MSSDDKKLPDPLEVTISQLQKYEQWIWLTQGSFDIINLYLAPVDAVGGCGIIFDL